MNHWLQDVRHMLFEPCSWNLWAFENGQKWILDSNFFGECPIYLYRLSATCCWDFRSPPPDRGRQRHHVVWDDKHGYEKCDSVETLEFEPRSRKLWAFENGQKWILDSNFFGNVPLTCTGCPPHVAGIWGPHPQVGGADAITLCGMTNTGIRSVIALELWSSNPVHGICGRLKMGKNEFWTLTFLEKVPLTNVQAVRHMLLGFEVPTPR